MHDLSKDEINAAMYAWMYMLGAGEPLADSVPNSIGWLRSRWDAGDDHLPLTFVHDLGLLLLRGRDFRFASARDLDQWREEERSARLTYEDRVLGRWALDPSVLEAHIAIAGMAAALRDNAVSHAVGIALSRALLECESMVCGNSAHLRALQSEIPSTPEQWKAVLGDTWAEWGFEQLAEAAKFLPTTKLFRPEDLWEIAHLKELPSESARLALREINGTISRIGPVPNTVALSIRHTAREVPVEAEEEDNYPTGGFDGVSTKGTFENLVRTEVVYVGEGCEKPGGIDLFDVRFIEGELLFYTRDESPMLDARRDVTFVFDMPNEQRHKQPALPAQTLVLTEACALAFQGDLLRIFGPGGSQVRLTWRSVSEEDTAASTQEKASLSLLLGSEIAHHRVELSVQEKWEDISDIGRIIFSPVKCDPKIKCIAWIQVGDDQWIMDEEKYDLREGHSAIRTLCNDLLVMLVKRQKLKLKKA